VSTAQESSFDFNMLDSRLDSERCHRTMFGSGMQGANIAGTQWGLPGRPHHVSSCGCLADR
jgi:hypothetical protein